MHSVLIWISKFDFMVLHKPLYLCLVLIWKPIVNVSQLQDLSRASHILVKLTGVSTPVELVLAALS